MRTFATGATRDKEDGKPDHTKSLSALAMNRVCQYMLKHNVQADGQRRELNNWKLGIPQPAYFASLGRHFMDLWLHWDGHPELAREADMEEILCAIIFNAQGLLHERLEDRLHGKRDPVDG